MGLGDVYKRQELALTTSPMEITAISVVPPPISITIFPNGSKICKLAPIAAAIGSSIVKTSEAPVACAAVSIDLCSTLVTPLGTQIIILGLE